MRAYTSLAGHILGSHPQINGYYEMHTSYEDASALDRQLEMFRQGDVLKAGSRYPGAAHQADAMQLIWR